MTQGGGRFGGDIPDLTPQGLETLSTRIPSRSDDRITVTNPSLSNYPTYQCNPDGFPNLVLDAEPIEFLMHDDRILQLIQWEGRTRVLWTDDRAVPSGENPIPGTSADGSNAACSICAKKFSGFRFSVIVPTGISG